MGETIGQHKARLQRLSPQQRADLAYFLLQSLEPEDEGADAAWNEEIARRVAEIRSGRAQGKPAEQVFAELRVDYP